MNNKLSYTKYDSNGSSRISYTTYHTGASFNIYCGQGSGSVNSYLLYFCGGWESWKTEYITEKPDVFNLTPTYLGNQRFQIDISCALYSTIIQWNM